MKRISIILITLVLGTTLCHATMSTSTVRKESRFLTDKMAYELNLSTYQYNDVYEINYDFIASIRYIMDAVLDGYEWALDEYYDYLDMRNDDLRYVLNVSQYSRFLATDYFFRPVYTSGNRWSFRVYITYTNRNQFYFSKPSCYSSYKGAHFRTRFSNTSYYTGRYNQPCYTGVTRIRSNEPSRYVTTRRSDFSTVTVRPNTSTRPSSTTSTRTGTTTRRSSGDDLYTPGTTRTSTTTSGSSASGTRTTTGSGTRTTRTTTTTGSGSSTGSSTGSGSTTGSGTRTTRTTRTTTTTSGSSTGSGSSVRSSSGSTTRSSSTSTSSGSSRSTSSGSSRSTRR